MRRYQFYLQNYRQSGMLSKFCYWLSMVKHDFSPSTQQAKKQVDIYELRADWST